MADTVDRRAELAANLADFHDRLAGACERAGRDPSEVTVVAVTKTFPTSDVRLLAELGVTDVGENRDQEAAAKHAECPDLALNWHFIGRLQRNKARSVARYADVVHSVDRLALVAALSQAAQQAGRSLVALVQVSTEPDPPGEPGGAEGRGGVAVEAAGELADSIAGAPGLTLGGVMTVAPLAGDPALAFARLADVAAALRHDHPDATIISAGMSGDFEIALAHGATHLRVGTALLGRRSVLVG
jgi:pyridoxal phosphate enzyme (YggS family)